MKIHSSSVALAFRELVVLVLLQFCCDNVWAISTTAYQAEKVVIGWLTTDRQPLGTSLGQQIIDVDTFSDTDGEPIYYVVYLHPSGFVIVPADDQIEPIIAFSSGGTYDPSPDNPLGAMVSQDMPARITAVRDIQVLSANQLQKKVLIEQAATLKKAGAKAQNKWSKLQDYAEEETSEPTMAPLKGDELREAPEGGSQGNKLGSFGTLSDVRVPPLVESKWSQKNICGSSACYNYYTPNGWSDGVVWDPNNPNNYYCGCVATAMAQLMRFHEHPTSGIGVHTFQIKVSGNSTNADTRGGDGQGGPYAFNNMVLVPDCNPTEAQLQAIGVLCYDAGVAAHMSYGPYGSGAWMDDARNALVSTFGYSNALHGAYYTLTGLTGMINPNLDAGYPTLLGIRSSKYLGGHAIICDGYGYNLLTLYHHLNMGWAGYEDAWYNLPDVGTYYEFDIVDVCIYNIFTSGSGEIISGRVTDTSGNPIERATVTAQERTNTQSGEMPTGDSVRIGILGQELEEISCFNGLIDDVRIYNRALTANEVGELDDMPSNYGLVSHWKFDEGSGDVAEDSSGYSNTGILINGPVWTAGRINGALDFDGTDDYIDCGNDSSLDLTGDLSIGLWFYARDWDTSLPSFISKRDSYGSMDWELFYNSRSKRIEMWYGNSGAYKLFGNLNVNPSLGTWHHLFVTRNGNTWTLYLDGNFAGGGQYTDETDSKGIYAMAKVPSGSTYTISVMKKAYNFTAQTVTIGTSTDGNGASGNRWGIDFQGSGVSDHVFSAGIYKGWDYGDPNIANDLTYNFYLGLETDDSFSLVEFQTPAGHTFTIPNDVNTQSGDVQTWHYVDNNRHYWEYEGEFTDQNAPKDYNDGIYTITVHYESGGQAETTVLFGDPNTGNSIPQPTQEPNLTFPEHNGMTTSPVTFTWEPCYDANATSIWLGLEKQDTNEVIDVNFPADVNSSDPITLSEGIWQAKLFFDHWYDFNNADGIPVEIGKYSESDYMFEVSYPSLVGHWKLDDDANNSTVVDSSGYANDGTAQQNTQDINGPGIIDGALTFNGISDYIDCGNDSSLDLTGDLSIGMWFYARNWDTSLLPSFISKRDSYGSMDWELFYNNNRGSQHIEMWYGNKGAYKLFRHLHVNPSLEAWHHLFVTRNGDTWTLYLNGNSQGTDTQSGAMPSGDSVRIGILGQGLEEISCFNGLIDDVRIYNRALSAEEVSTLNQ